MGHQALQVCGMAPPPPIGGSGLGSITQGSLRSPWATIRRPLSGLRSEDCASFFNLKINKLTSQAVK